MEISWLCISNGISCIVSSFICIPCPFISSGIWYIEVSLIWNCCSWISPPSTNPTSWTETSLVSSPPSTLQISWSCIPNGISCVVIPCICTPSTFISRGISDIEVSLICNCCSWISPPSTNPTSWTEISPFWNSVPWTMAISWLCISNGISCICISCAFISSGISVIEVSLTWSCCTWISPPSINPTSWTDISLVWSAPPSTVPTSWLCISSGISCIVISCISIPCSRGISDIEISFIWNCCSWISPPINPTSWTEISLVKSFPPSTVPVSWLGISNGISWICMPSTFISRGISDIAVSFIWNCCSWISPPSKNLLSWTEISRVWNSAPSPMAISWLWVSKDISCICISCPFNSSGICVMDMLLIWNCSSWIPPPSTIAFSWIEISLVWNSLPSAKPISWFCISICTCSPIISVPWGCSPSITPPSKYITSSPCTDISCACICCPLMSSDISPADISLSWNCSPSTTPPPR